MNVISFSPMFGFVELFINTSPTVCCLCYVIVYTLSSSVPREGGCQKFLNVPSLCIIFFWLANVKKFTEGAFCANITKFRRVRIIKLACLKKGGQNFQFNFSLKNHSSPPPPLAKFLRTPVTVLKTIT